MTDERVFADERRYDILQRVRSAGRVEVSSLAAEFGVSTETIRQDLNSLQESGVIRRTHGGAVPVERTLIEPRVTDRTTFTAEKRAIAAAALAHVPAEGSIFIESGSTSMPLAESLPPDSALTVFTNSLPIAMLLSQRPQLTVITLGGRVRPVTLGEVDSFALRSLRDIHVDAAFLGTNGVSVEHGLTTPDQAEADVKRETLRISAHTVLLADRSKIGTVSLWRYGSLSDVDVMITSARADAAEVEMLTSAGTVVELA